MFLQGYSSLVPTTTIVTQGAPRISYQFQIKEIKSLMSLYKDDNAYKRIRKNKLNLIKFEDYRAFVAKLKIKNYSSTAEQKVDEYKLERTLGFELIKKILKAKHELDTIILDDLISLYKLPDIESRQKVADIYVNSIKSRSLEWNKIISKTTETTQKIADEAYSNIHYLVEELPYEHDSSAIENYLKGRYINDFTLGKDFEEVDFKSLMKRIQLLYHPLVEAQKSNKSSGD